MQAFFISIAIQISSVEFELFLMINNFKNSITFIMKSNIKSNIHLILITLSLVFLISCSKDAGKSTSERSLNEVQDTEITASEEQKEMKDIAIPDLYSIEVKDGRVLYTDYQGVRQSVALNPQRVVICYNSLLDQWYFSGGTSLSRVRGTSNLPDEAKDLIDLGSMLSLSTESILSLNPDLVIMNAALENQVGLAKMLRSLNIDVLLIDSRMNGYSSFINNIELFSTVNDKADDDHSLTQDIENTVESTVERAGLQTNVPEVAILFASSSNIYMETQSAQVGEMVDMLGATNIIKEDAPGASDVRIPFNLEYIAQSNPDVIFVSLMGSEDETKKAFEAELFDNSTFQSLKAFKNNRIYYLPKEYGIYKPNANYGKAFEYIYSKLYETE